MYKIAASGKYSCVNIRASQQKKIMYYYFKKTLSACLTDSYSQSKSFLNTMWQL